MGAVQQKTYTVNSKNSKKTIDSASDKSKTSARNNSGVVSNATGKFAEGLCFQKLFFVFLFGSVFGTIYEDILIYIQTYLATGEGVWMIHRGVIYGPFNVIYGFGAALMCWFLLRRKYSNSQVFILSALLGGAVEFALSFLQETFTGTTSCDYTDLWLTIDGRTTIPIMFVWGLLGLVLVKVIYPVFSKLIESIPRHIGTPVYWVLLVFMICNCLISWTAIIRQNLRHNDIPPITPVGYLCDKYYPDSYLQKYYPNMVRSEDR